MKFNSNACKKCDKCKILDICPTNAISIVDDKAFVSQDNCTECNVCVRERACSLKAIRRQILQWPRIIRNPFSDVVSTHKTGIAGRGTEEMKTNDITSRYKFNEIGFSIELGRPGVGCYLGDIEKFSIPLSKIGVEFESNSPVTELFTDNLGHIKDEVKNEKVLSAILEFKIRTEEKIPLIFELLRYMDKNIDTVFSVGVISRYNENFELPIIATLSKEGFYVRPNSKINVGLGKSED